MYRILLCSLLLLIRTGLLIAQNQDSLLDYTGRVLDKNSYSVPGTHVINMDTHKGDVTDSSGIFIIQSRVGDQLLFRNIAFRDTIIRLSSATEINVLLSHKNYPIPELKVFEWGSTYKDFKKAFLEMPMERTLGEKLGLPQQSGDTDPFFLKEDVISSARYFFNSPVNFLYYNLSKTEKSRRKVYELRKNEFYIDRFNKIYCYEEISRITGLQNEELLRFMSFMEKEFQCDIFCNEYQIVAEIFRVWKKYRKEKNEITGK